MSHALSSVVAVGAMLLVSAGCEEHRSLRFFQYQGRYALTGAAIGLEFGRDDLRADAVLMGDTLDVRYNERLRDDFEDAVFVRQPSTRLARRNR